MKLLTEKVETLLREKTELFNENKKIQLQLYETIRNVNRLLEENKVSFFVLSITMQNYIINVITL